MCEFREGILVETWSNKDAFQQIMRVGDIIIFVLGEHCAKLMIVSGIVRN